jgi:small subunit ribosomal protein S2
MNHIFELKNNNHLLINNFKKHVHNSVLVNEQQSFETDVKFILKMIKASVHFGHKMKEWNPRIAPFIYQKIGGIHIIDIVQSYTYLKKTCKFIYKQASNKNYKTFLFVGTNKESPIPDCVFYHAIHCNSFFVNKKWLSGMLTNWRNTKRSINELKYLKIYQKTNKFKKLPMKMRSTILKKKERLQRYFGGIQKMVTIPDIVFLIGQQNELNANKECKKLGIRTVTLLDTNCNPELTDLFIPGNDDSSSSLNLILGEFQIAINLGRQQFCAHLKKEKNFVSILKTVS